MVLFIIECLVVFVIVLYLLGYYFNKPRRSLKELPGPFSLPLVGHVQLFFKREQYKYLTELGEIYGEIYKFQLGGKTVIVLNSMNVIREALNEWLFTGRPFLHSFETFNASNNHRRLQFITYSPEWKFLRKNAIKGLMLFASSKNSRLEKVVHQAIDSFHEDLAKNLNSPFNPKSSIAECVSGIIGAINYGLQFNRDDPLLKKIVRLTDIVGKFIQLGTFLDYFPLGKIIMGYKVKKFLDEIEPLNIITDNAIRSHKVNEEITDVADALYKKRQEATEEELKEANVTAEDIQLLSQDLFAAGFATTMETLYWSLMIMAVNPKVQDKVAEELRQKIKPGVHPSLNDIKSTPYTEATLLEIFRFASLVPLNVPHSTVVSGKFRGYYIPANAVVISNLWNIHHDSLVFEKPFEFNPLRFLNEDGSLNMDMAQNIAPFSVGKRRCVGENLARQELYLLLAAIVKKFSINPAPGENINVHEADPGFIRRVNQHNLIFKLR